VQGINLGAQSLAKNVIDGACGSASRIVGTLGKGVAILTFDKEYQRQRQDSLNQKPENVCKGIAKGLKGIVRNTLCGVTGVVMKPIQGARTGGCCGFAKGVGIGGF